MCSAHQIRSLFEYSNWADKEILSALHSRDVLPSEALREYSHAIGTQAVWLARVQGRLPAAAIWPELSLNELQTLVEQVHTAYRDYLGGLADVDLARNVCYTNSQGREFVNSVGDILLHVVLHGQYHRGKVNLLLRNANQAPAPTDYIAFMRGAPAATEQGKSRT